MSCTCKCSLGPDAPVFPDMPRLEEVEHEFVQAMRATGAHPATIQAFIETGLIVTESSMASIPDNELLE